MTGIVIIVYGLPGSGKTTVARRIESDLPASVRLSNDDVRIKLGLPKKGKEFTDQVYDKVFNLSIKCLNRNYMPILDATFYRREFRKRLFDRLNNYFSHYLIIYVNTPSEICETRVKRRGDDENVGVNDISIFNKIMSSFEQFNYSEIHEPYTVIDIDTTNNNDIIIYNSGAINNDVKPIIELIIKSLRKL